MASLPDPAAVREAARRIRPHVHRTPVFTSQTLNSFLQAELFFKCENLQKTGSFKARGAGNAVFSLTEAQAERGVLTHSSGNHAAALAMAAQRRGIRAYLVMPSNSPRVKRAAVEAYGGEVHICEPSLAARQAMAAELQEKTGAALIHPYDDPRVIAGQGSAALEFLEQASKLDYLLAPVGGGGLVSGAALAAAELSPPTKVVGVEPQDADFGRRSLEKGRIVTQDRVPRTIADGLRTSPGELTFALMRRRLHDILTVSDDEIVHALRLVLERMKLLIEPSAAAPLAALLAGKLAVSGKRVGIILSGGNVELGALARLVAATDQPPAGD